MSIPEPLAPVRELVSLSGKVAIVTGGAVGSVVVSRAVWPMPAPLCS